MPGISPPTKQQGGITSGKTDWPGWPRGNRYRVRNDWFGCSAISPGLGKPHLDSRLRCVCFAWGLYGRQRDTEGEGQRLMASLHKQTGDRPGYKIRWRDSSKQPRALWLGDVSKRSADTYFRHVCELIDA